MILSMDRGFFRKAFTLIGDWAVLYLALFLMLAARYRGEWPDQWAIHFHPFSLLFPVWILIIYANYLYETRFFRPSLDGARAMGNATLIAFLFSLSLFYLFPPGLIHPRRNLLIFTILAGVMLLIWRVFLYRLFRKTVVTNVLCIGGGSEVAELVKYLKDTPALRYRVRKCIDSVPARYDDIAKIIGEHHIQLVLFKPRTASGTIKNLFPMMSSGVMVLDFEDFYERTLNKVSPYMLNDMWFIKNLENVTQNIHEVSKRVIDILVGALASIVLAIITPFMVLLIKLDSPGPAIFKQERVGKGGKVFRLYKFRTMRSIGKDGSAEGGTAVWAQENDPRITRVGRLLRRTRLDELPQLWNILKGDMSIVGPRPERPGFVEKLTRKIPHYNMRHLVKPGLTGWAQINYEYGDSVKDALIKLQYDIYYAKKRSLILDCAIILKTMRMILTGAGR